MHLSIVSSVPWRHRLTRWAWALSDALVELKAVCECGRKATMNLRVDQDGFAVARGAQTEIGGNDRYVALCRRHFFERLKEGEARQLSLGLARR